MREDVKRMIFILNPKSYKFELLGEGEFNTNNVVVFEQKK